MFFVYILQSQKDYTFYTGLTQDVSKRLIQHNQSVTKTTRARQPWKLVYTEKFLTRADGRAREKFRKSGLGRELRLKLPGVISSLPAGRQGF